MAGLCLVQVTCLEDTIISENAMLQQKLATWEQTLKDRTKVRHGTGSKSCQRSARINRIDAKGLLLQENFNETKDTLQESVSTDAIVKVNLLLSFIIHADLVNPIAQGAGELAHGAMHIQQIYALGTLSMLHTVQGQAEKDLKHITVISNAVTADAGACSTTLLSG